MMNQLPTARFSALLTAVLAASCVLPVQASDNKPSVYGRLNVSADKVKYDGASLVIRGDAAASDDEWQLSSNTSMIGVKGKMDMDFADLQLIYQAEFEIYLDDGKSSSGDTFSQRNVFAGLSHKRFGTLKAGRFDTPFKKAEGKIDQFGDLKADMDVLIGGQNRISNSIQYSTPAFADMVTVNIAAIEAEGADVDGDGQPDTGFADVLSSSVVLEYNWLYAAIAYENNQGARRSVDGIMSGSERVDAMRAVFKATIAGFEGGVLLQQSKDAADNSKLRDDSTLVSAAYTIDRFKLKAQLGRSDGKVSEERGELAAIGLDVRLGGKTTVYTYGSQLKLKNADLKDTTYAVGIKHLF